MKLVVQRMLDTAETVNDWLNILKSVEYDIKIRRLILEKIAEFDLSFIEWMQMYDKVEDVEMMKLIANKLVQLDSVFEDWTSVYLECSGHSDLPLQVAAFEKLGAFEFTFAEWQERLRAIRRDRKLGELVLRKMLETAETIDDLTAVYFGVSEVWDIEAARVSPSVLEQEVLARIAEFDLTHEKWGEIEIRARSTRLGKLAKEKKLKEMSKLARTCRDWRYVWANAKDDDELKTLAWQERCDSAEDCKDWLIIAEDSEDGSDDEGRALLKAEERANVFADWHRYYYVCHRKNLDDKKQNALQKMEETAETREDWEDLFETVSPGSATRIKALKKRVELADAP